MHCEVNSMNSNVDSIECDDDATDADPRPQVPK